MSDGPSNTNANSTVLAFGAACNARFAAGTSVIAYPAPLNANNSTNVSYIVGVETPTYEGLHIVQQGLIKIG